MMSRERVRATVILAACAGCAHAQPAVRECQWQLARTIQFADPCSLAYNPFDDSLYVGRRNSASDGLYRIAADGTVTFIAYADRPSSVAVDPLDGDVFIAEDYDGVIFRVTLGSNIAQVWVSGFRSGDDDPVGVAIVPPGYTGAVVPPLTALSADRGYTGGYDDLWKWSPDTPEGELQLHTDTGALLDAVDIAVNNQRIVVVDDRGNPGKLWEITSSAGALSEITTSTPIANPLAAVFEPTSSDLFVASPDRVVRVGFARGVGDVTEVVASFAQLNWGSIDFRSDGAVFWVADSGADAVYEFVRAGPCPSDVNGDCQVDFFDYLDFAAALDAEDPAADFNGDSQVDFFDYLDFVAAFDSGC